LLESKLSITSLRKLHVSSVTTSKARANTVSLVICCSSLNI
jgi:hypothetical protein